MEKPIFKFRDSDSAGLVSEEITFGDAQEMHTKYLENPLQVMLPSGAVKDLKGFSFDKSDILEILNRTDHNVEKLFIMFGADPNGYVKIIGGGINDNNQLLDDKLFDMCDPCPDKCPFNINDFIKQPNS